MDSRRSFLKKAALLSGAAGFSSLPPSIQRAFAINPEKGTTYLDAEHVVILMQENRSFDHCYGSLQGVRGFNDPQAIRLPDNNLVWLQSNSKGETFAPFRLNIKDTNATWMGSLPHSWTDQTDARNEGRHDQWLQAKQSGHKDYKDMPLALGYYNREDLPFYYSFADAFTICDQNFCSSLTGTTPNRLFLWTGKIREDVNSQARVRNEETDYRREAAWRTFPELLEDNNVSWKIYQNEISVGVGLQGEEDAWLANFTDNPIEWFEQYQVRFHPEHIQYLPKKIESLKNDIAAHEAKLKTLQQGSEDYHRLASYLEYEKKELAFTLEDLKKYTAENYRQLKPRDKNLHEKAFTTNRGDANYHAVSSLNYKDGDTSREMKVPRGDVLHQFRQDVKNNKLPTVSWLVAPENFSDHPGAPWYGAWYLSEAMDILTQNPEVWKKTIFILCYDENDGYFDHVPPFTPPMPGKGVASKDIDGKIEYVALEQDLKRKQAPYARGGPVGLGYRVPLVIASPWSRGGAVCSQVFDHTSIIQFVEQFVSHKTGKKIEESNISPWRRTICGDLSSVFKPYNGENIDLPPFISRDEFVEDIHKAQFKKIPSGFHALTKPEIDNANHNPATSVLPRQEKGVRTSRALPYELYADGFFDQRKKIFSIKFAAGNKVHGNRAAGAPFQVYATEKDFSHRTYAVVAGDTIQDHWEQQNFLNDSYHLKAYGPNGFFREFKGKTTEPSLQINCVYEMNAKQLSGNIRLDITNTSNAAVTIQIKDNAYRETTQTKTIAKGANVSLIISTNKSFGWYDLSVLMDSHDDFEYRYAGRVETGKDSMSDPAMA